MPTQLKPGDEVVRRGASLRMVILAIDEDRASALCQWHDTAGGRKTQQFAVDELVLAVDRGPLGGKLAAARRGPAARRRLSEPATMEARASDSASLCVRSWMPYWNACRSS
jgi:uncharacterized protein YodC (DUF2158 family)